MQVGWLVACSIVTAAVVAGPAVAQDADDSLRLYAVHIDRTPKQTWTGYGVYLGAGLVLTAAHVVGWAFWNKPRVEIGGKDFPAKVVKEGSLSSVDVTLLSVDERELPLSLGLRRISLCRISPFPGERIIVVTPEEIARSQVMPPYALPLDVPAKFTTVISDVATTGNSGSGVFDENKKCLLGIVSRKISEVRTKQENGQAVRESLDIAKYFVPAPLIAEFMAPDLHF
jgi:hypothetical protein